MGRVHPCRPTGLRAAGGLVLLVLALALTPVPAGAENEAEWNGRDSAGEVRELTKEYFDAAPGRRAEIRDVLDGLGVLSERDAKKWAKALLKEARRHGPKITHKSGEPFRHGLLTGVVYKAGRPKRRGALFVALHGGGEGNGDGRNALQKWSFVQSKAFVLAPTAPELRGSAWNHEDIEQWVLALIGAAIRSFDLDPDRVYLAGHSMGGYGTWSIGCRHADRFAALAACAGGVFGIAGTERIAGGHVPNLLGTPIWFYNSTDDRQVSPKSAQIANRELQALKEAGYPYEWVYDEYDDIGHGLPPKGLKPIVDWMREKKRRPYPRHVVWEPSRPSKRRFAWLGLERDGWIEGKVEGNRVDLVTKGDTGRIAVYLNGELVDVAKAITVTRNGEEVHRGPVPARLSVLLDTIAEGQDPAQYYDRLLQLE